MRAAAALRAWWRLCPLWARIPIVAPEVVIDLTSRVPVFVTPRSVQLVYLQAGQPAFEDLYRKMQIMERDYPEGGGKVHLTLARGARFGDWRNSYVLSEPPQAVFTRAGAPPAAEADRNRNGGLTSRF